MSSVERLGGVQVAPEKGVSRPARIVLELLSGLDGGAIMLALPGRAPVRLGNGPVVAHWKVHDTSTFERVLARGDIGLAEAWMEGLWACDDLTALLLLLARNRRKLGRAVYGRVLGIAACRLRHWLHCNTRRGARRNIVAHYDLGNEFYRLWLDPSMTYSSALFAAHEEPLEQAQLRKYRRILEYLEAKPGQEILEIGCGWGGFAEVAVREFGCRVHGLTLSPAQREWACSRAVAGGYAHAVRYELCDYRDSSGSYDHVVSIEMLEAVGERFWPAYFRTLAARLKRGGRCVLQAITIDESLFTRYRRGTDFIQQYIFPGGMLPSDDRVHTHARRAELQILTQQSFGRDYARTLDYWRWRFLDVSAEVRQQGFDERFLRTWQFYLAYCEAGFAAGDIDVRHYVLSHA